MKTLRRFVFLLVFGLASGLIHATPGDLDALNANVVGSTVFATAVQPDGKTIIAGQFSSVLGVPRQNIARLNANGTLDMGFDPKANSSVNSVAVQADGKVLLGGNFTTLQPNDAGAATTRQRIARVNGNGTLDLGFDPKANGEVISVAVQADGKVLLGGGFTTLQPNGAGSATTRNSIARLNADGTLELGFNPNANDLGGGERTVHSVAVQADGKILLGGAFTTLQPNGGASTTRNRIARVNANGTLDTGFDPNADRTVFSVALQADGKILLGGLFATLQPNGASASTRNRIARVNANGTLDMGFDPNADRNVYSVAVQADGKVLLGGVFTTLQPGGAGSATTRNRIARVNSDGTLDLGFNPNANSDVYSVAVQADGKVLLGGIFTTLQPNGAGAVTPRNLFARLVNDPATQSLTNLNASGVQWLRGGAAPEVEQVTFELSTDSGTSYSALGVGTRISGGWERTGLSLPGSGLIRARARTSGGDYNGSGGLVETVVSLGYPEIAIEQPAGTPLRDSVVAWGRNQYGQTNVPVGLTGVTAIAAGYGHTVALKSDGSIIAWGRNDSGQTTVPVGLTGVTAIAAGDYHTVALKSDGTVVAWGNNAFGQRTVPGGLTGVTAIAAGQYHTVARKSDGSVVAWGWNLYGQTAVPGGLTGVTAIAAGDDHTVALGGDGSVVAWGNNNFGQTNVPGGLTGVTAIAAGVNHTVALWSDGSVVAWGDNSSGQTAVPGGLTGVTAIAAGYLHTVARKSDGSVVAWGWNDNGQTTVPAGLTGVTAIAAGFAHTVALAPTAYFGVQTVATTSVAKTFTIKNTGNAPLTINSVSVTGGNASDFTVNTIGMLTSVPATTGSTTFTVTFTPSALGARQTILRVLNNDSNEGVFDIDLGGTGAVPEIAVSGNSVNIADGDATPDLADHTNFGSALVIGETVLRTFTVYNTGGVDLTLGSVTVGGVNAADFSVNVQPLTPIAPSGSTTFQITFNPSANGLRAATLSFANNDADENPFNFAIQGTGTAPEINVQGNSVTITAGDTTPTATDHTDFGAVSAASGTLVRTFTVQNTGTADLTVSSIAVSGMNAADFTLGTLSPTSPVAPSSSATFTVTFDPSALGDRSAIITVNNNDSDEAAYGFAIQGTGVDPEINVQGNGMNISDGDTTPSTQDHTDFGSMTTASGTVVRTFTVQNTGNANLTVDSLAVSGTHAADFTVGDLTPASPVSPGSSATFTVTFDPSVNVAATGLRTATVSFDTNDPDEALYNFDIQGTGTAPEINLRGNNTDIISGDTTPSTTDHTDFGSVNTASGTVVRTFTVQNTGTAELTLGSVIVGGTHAADFTLGAFTPASPVLPSGSATFTVTFDPSANGTRPATIVVNNNDSDEAAYDFAIQGAGSAPEIAIEQPAGIALAGSLVVWGSGSASVMSALGGLTGVTAIAAGNTHTVALKSDGSVVAWGSNNLDGQATVPVGLTGVTAIAAGGSHTVALKSDGSVVAWGRNSEGQTDVPVGLTGGRAITAGSYHTVALKSDGSVVAWGDNAFGQTTVPVGLTGVTAIAAGGRHTVALKSDGSVVAWGRNSDGQTSVPVGLTGVTAIAAGNAHTVALKSDGSVVAWGYNQYGQTTLPVGLAGVTAIVAGGYHTVALKSNGSVVAWGWNEFGQTDVPVGLTGVTAIAAGAVHTLALNSNGTIGFGVQVVATTSAAKTFTVKNIGDGPLTISSVSVIGGQASDFSVNTAGMLTSVPAVTGQTSFAVTFSPSAPGARQTTLRVVNSDSDEGSFDIVLTGTGTGSEDREIAVAGNSVNITDGDSTPALSDHTDFGSVNVAGSTLVRTYTITNSGTADLTLGTVTVGGTHAADFTVSLQPVSPVAPSASTSFQVTFDPSGLGPRSATLSFSNNDADEDPFNFAIQGTGVTVPDAPLILSAMPLDQAARISFNAPISDGGSAILDYSASCTPGPISNTQNALAIDVGGLTNNVAYRCSVRARNAVGMSAPSSELSVIPGSSGSSADLSITKTNSSTFVNGGAYVDYTITVSNPGPAAVIGARVEDAIGAGTDFSAALWTCTPLNNAACPNPASGSGSLNVLVDLPVTSSVQFVFGALPNPGPETPIANTASVTPPANITDANLNNNIASDGPDIRGILRNGFE